MVGKKKKEILARFKKLSTKCVLEIIYIRYICIKKIWRLIIYNS